MNKYVKTLISLARTNEDNNIEHGHGCHVRVRHTVEWKHTNVNLPCTGQQHLMDCSTCIFQRARASYAVPTMRDNSYEQVLKINNDDGSI